MSASREKKLRQDPTPGADPKTFKELEQAKAEKRSNLLYSVIGVLFLVAVVACLIWKSNIISRSATAVTIDGEKYTAAEVSFYYQNVYRSFLQNNSYFISYLGLDTGSSLKGQTVNATAASKLGVEEGSSWHDYMMDNTIKQMTMIQNGLKEAEAKGFQYPAGVKTQYDDTMQALKDTAVGSGTTVKKYLQQNLGSTMTEKVYGQELLRTLQYQAYANAYSDELTYSDQEIQDAYNADPKTYDRASWEYVVVSGAAESTTDADGNTVQPTDEETAAAKEAAKETADKILAAYKSGTSLESAAGGYEKATYYDTRDASYYDGVIGNWLFDDARQSGDTDVLEVSDNYYVAVFHDRYLEESNTVSVRHILVMPEAGTKTSDEEGYDEEQEQLKAAAHTKAEEILAEWKAGDATEDSFIDLVTKDSEDGTKYTGGLISDISVDSSLVDSFKDWALDSSRKPGDTDVVDSTYGSHVMYFVGTGLPVWKAAVVNTLRSDDVDEWTNSLVEGADVSQSDFGMKFVG